MNNKKDFYYHFFAIAIFFLLKFVYRFFDNTTLLFLLKPVNFVVSILTNSKWIFLQEDGFYHEDLNIVINKSCSGYNFLLLCFLLIYLASKKLFRGKISGILLYPGAMLISWVITLFANSSRIVTSILLQQKLRLQNGWLHEANGIFIYLSILIALYLSIVFITQKYLKYEKSIKS